MAFVFGDRVYETSTTTGNGTLTLAGIGAANYRTFSDVIGNGNTCYYSIVHRNANEWEVGVGTVSAGALARTTVLKTSAGNTTKIVFSAGTKDVFCDLPAERIVAIDAAGTALTDLTGVAVTAGAASFTTGAFSGNLTVGASKFVVTAATGAVAAGKGTFQGIEITKGTGTASNSVGVGPGGVLGSATTGIQNVAIGYGTLGSLTQGSLTVAVGYNSGASLTTAGGGVFLGPWAGTYETAADAFYVNNQDRNNTAGDKAKSLLYGTFNATAASQTLAINAGTITTIGSLAITGALTGVTTLATSGAITSDGGVQTFGANDSGGAGYRLVVVPNV